MSTAPAGQSTDAPLAERGLYCSTSGTYFTDKEALAAHYKSDFHRYNLKRKVAGLPPVTREWYDSRAAALKASLTSGTVGGASSSTSSSALVGARTWLDPLTHKKFTSEATYRTFVSSKKYKELVKKSGQPAPEAVVVAHSLESSKSGGGSEGGNGGGATTRSQAAKKKQQQQATATTKVLPAMATPTTSAAATAAAFRVVAPNGVTFAAGNDMEVEVEEEEEEEEDARADDNSSGWETASDGADEEPIEPWDPTVSFFDNKKFATVEACLEHMWKKFSFYIPDVQHCSDPEGLLGYLGAKLRSGLVPLYCRGDDETSKRFHSLHAVQRHMIDMGNCRVCWEGNEDEYGEWYQWSDDDDEDDDEMDYGDDDDDDADGFRDDSRNASATEEAFELALPNGKVIGARAFAKFYRQSHRPFARAANGTRVPQQQQRALAGAGAAARASNPSRGSASSSLALTAAGREQQRSAIVARYRAMGVKEADVPAAAKKERKARNAQQRGRARETLRSALAANINRNLPKNVPY